MKKIITLVLSAMMMVGCATTFMGCGSSNSGSDSNSKKDDLKKITFVWYPNESGGEYEEARNDVISLIKEATGLEVESKLTTDYSVAIESLANGTAQMGFLGAQGYVEANTKNKAVQPLFVSSGESGTLDDALYYSWLAVRTEDADEYKDSDSYSIDNIQGKKMSFVSTSSTSGFKVPTSNIVNHFSTQDKWKNLTAEDLLEGGSDKFFSEVAYGNSHQGSAVNLLSGKSDVAAFCDTELMPYSEVADGELNDIGTTYKIKDGAADPFTDMAGKEYTTIAVSPVLNSPFVCNTDELSQDVIDKVVKYFTSDEVSNNEKIFVPKDSDGMGFFTKKGDEKFIAVKDDWFDPIRKLSK